MTRQRLFKTIGRLLQVECHFVLEADPLLDSEESRASGGLDFITCRKMHIIRMQIPDTSHVIKYFCKVYWTCFYFFMRADWYKFKQQYEFNNFANFYLLSSLVLFGNVVIPPCLSRSSPFVQPLSLASEHGARDLISSGRMKHGANRKKMQN